MLRTSRKRDVATEDHPTKRRLVDETTRRIMDDGIEAVDVDEVLTAVGVTQGSLYHHFGSVNGLLIAGLLNAFETAVRESEAWSIALKDECRSAREARDRLHQIIDVSQVRERRVMRSVRLHALSMARNQPELGEKVAQLQAGVTETMTEVIREFQKRGWTRPEVDPRALAVLIQSMNLGRIVDDVVDDDHRVEPAAWIALYNDVLDRFFIVDE